MDHPRLIRGTEMGLAVDGCHRVVFVVDSARAWCVEQGNRVAVSRCAGGDTPRGPTFVTWCDAKTDRIPIF